MDWFFDNIGLVLSLSLDHIRLSAIPIVVSFFVAVPLGWVAHRYAWSKPLVLTTVGLLYTIPSLALFMLIPALLGISVLSEINVVLALSVYAVAIMVRTAADAFASIDPAFLRSATALGYSESGRHYAVELPLAGPVLLAGIRVVSVSTVSLVTVGVLVGVPSLGFFFTDGFQRRIIPEVMTGVVMTLVIALLFDLLLVLAGRLILPWARIAEREHKQAIS